MKRFITDAGTLNPSDLMEEDPRMLQSIALDATV